MDIISQIFDLIKVALISLTCIFISRKIYSRQAKKLTIKYKDEIVITTEYFEK